MNIRGVFYLILVLIIYFLMLSASMEVSIIKIAYLGITTPLALAIMLERKKKE